MNVTQKLIKDHLVEGEMTPGKEIGLKIDQVLQQDATGTLIMLELEAVGLDRTQAEVAVQYVDHNLLQTDFKNADDHNYLQASSAKLGYWFSRAGNGISHVVHMERFGIPGKTLLGSDSHTPAGGGLGMLAIGTGGLDVAMASAGKPYFVKMPKVLGVKLTGELPDWVSAKDLVLEMLRRYDVKGCVNHVIEYYGPGVKNLSTWDRHVIANMGTEMGATSTVFPSDEITKDFLRQQNREKDWVEIKADEGASYDAHEEIDMSKLVPLIARPSSPGDVVPVTKVEGKEVAQVLIGSSANPGLRDFSIPADILEDKTIDDRTALDINPSSRQTYHNLIRTGRLAKIINSGARIQQAGCMGCIGMGQAPPSGSISLRTMPRNFPGRSGTIDDKVYLCSPETATAAALTGKITDPRKLEELFNMSYPQWEEPEDIRINTQMLTPPKDEEDAAKIKIEKGPNIKTLPEFDDLQDEINVPVILKMDDNISTDEILKAGSDVLPFRSNIEELSKYAFWVIDRNFYDRATAHKGGHAVIAGENYAQGSSREHAALCPRHLGQRAVIAKSYARIGWQNLVNFGIAPFVFVNPSDYDKLEQGDEIRIRNVREGIKTGKTLEAEILGKDSKFEVKCDLSDRQIEVLLEGGLINYVKKQVS
ncbi:aconitate hydratase [Halocola ammonii]